MKTEAKRLIAMLLTIVMVLSMAPATALAAPGDEQGLPIYFFIAMPGTEPTADSNYYASYPGYTQGSARATLAANNITSDGIRNVTDESIVTQYIIESTLPNGSLSDFENFGTKTFSFGYGGNRTYSSEEYDIVWVSISQKTGYDASASKCNCNLRNTPHIHIDGVLSKKVSIPDEVILYKSIPTAQSEDVTFNFKLEKLLQDERYAPTAAVDPNFAPIEMSTTIEAGETRAKVTGAEGIVGNFGYYRLTEHDDPIWKAKSPVYIEIATNGNVKYSYNLNANSFAPSSSGATMENEYRTYTVSYDDGFEDIEVFLPQTSVGLRYGAPTPGFVGGTPMYPDHTMVFNGWSPAVANTVTESVTYVAQWKDNAYTVTWQDEDGTPLEIDEDVVNGTMPEYNGETPSKAADAQYTYEFAGWTPVITEVNGSDQTYTAVYTPVLNEYTVIWKDADGTVLETDENVPYHTFPTYDNTGGTTAALAEAKSDDQYLYRFVGWSPAPVRVEGNQEYVATYTKTLKTYTVRWENYDGSELETDTPVEYGTTPEYNGTTPERVPTTHYSYTFTGWTDGTNNYGLNDTFPTVTGDVTYTATYTPVQIKFTGTVKLILDDTTPMDIETLMGQGTKLYLKDTASDTYYDLTEVEGSIGVYENTALPNGDYQIYAKGGKLSDYLLICEQHLDIQNNNRERTVYFNSVTYDANGGSYSGTSPEYYHEGSQVSVSGILPVRDGYDFLGWAYNSKTYAPGVELFIAPNGITEPVKLVAQWEEATRAKVNVHLEIHHSYAGGTNPEPGIGDIEIQLTQKAESDAYYVESQAERVVLPGGTWLIDDGGEDNNTEGSAGDVDYVTVLYPNDVPAAQFEELSTDWLYSANAFLEDYVVLADDDLTYVTSSTDAKGNVTYDVYITMQYQPELFHVDYVVIANESIPDALIPTAVDLKITSWDANAANAWSPISRHTNNSVDVHFTELADGQEEGDKFRQGSGSYAVPVYRTELDDDGNLVNYYYRVEVVGFTLPDGTELNASGGQTLDQYQSIAYGGYAGGAYKASVDVVSDSGFMGGAEGVYGEPVEGNQRAFTQNGSITVYVTVETHNITIDPNGGSLRVGTTDYTSEAPYRLKDLFSAPNVSSYVPTRDGGYVFNGYTWYSDSNDNGVLDDGEAEVSPIADGTALSGSYILVANWKLPLSVKGTVVIPSTYTNEEGELREINEADLVKEVTILLQQANPGTEHYVTMYTQKVTVSYDDTGYGMGDYEFTGVPDFGSWRISTLTRNYDATYQHEPDSLDAEKLTDRDAYLPEEDASSPSVAVDTDDDKVAVVNVYKAFEPAEFDLWFEVIATAIGEGFRAKEAKVLVLYDDDPNTSTSSRTWPVISQMQLPGEDGEIDEGAEVLLAASDNYYGSGIVTYPVWAYHPAGYLYDYAIRLQSFGDITDIGNAPFNVSYNGSARYQENADSDAMQQTRLLIAVLQPKSYPIRYYLQEGSTFELTGLTPSTHTWSHETDLSTAIPTRVNHIFKGWVDAQGNPVTRIDASVAAETKLYATWYEDNWADADADPDDDVEKDAPIGGDGIPDDQQVHIRYIAGANGTVSLIGEIVTISGTDYTDVEVSATSGSTATAASGYALDQWAYEENADANATVDMGQIGTTIKPTIENADGGVTYIFHASFDTDKKGDEDDGGGDGTPDKYQAFVEFRSANVNHGTVTGKVYQTVTFANGATSGSVTPSLDGVIVTPVEDYAFDYWVKDNEAQKLSNADVETTIENVKGNTTIVFTANFEIDEWTDADETVDPDDEDTDEKGDGIPDYKQVLVEFVAAANGRGTVTGEGAVQVFTLEETNGQYVGSVTPVNTEENPVVITANEGYAFDYWGDTTNFWTHGYGAEVENPFVEHENVVGGEIIVYTAHFWTDNWKDDPDDGEDSEEGGDDIPDNRQILIAYVSDNEEQGTVTPALEIISLTNGKGPEDVKAAGATATAREGYAFDRWYDTEIAGDVVYTPTDLTIVPVIEDAMGGEHYIFTATFGEDKLEDPDLDPDDEEPGDDIPDDYQIVVTYRVVGGTWDGEDNEDKTAVFTQYQKVDGEWVLLDPLPTLGDTIPDVSNAAPNESHYGDGKWDVEPHDSDVAVDGMVYIYGFGSKLLIIMQDENGVQLKNAVVSVEDSYLIAEKAGENVDYVIPESIEKDEETYIYDGVVTGKLEGEVNDDNEIIVIVLQYTLDELDDAGDQPTGGDDIPDKYQALVTYKIEGGTWDGTNADDRYAVFSLKELVEGEWQEVMPEPTLGSTIPNVAEAKHDAYHDVDGSWDVEPKASDVAVDGAVYTYSFAPLFSAQLQIIMQDENGVKLDEDEVSVSGHYRIAEEAGQNVDYVILKSIEKDGKNYIYDGVVEGELEGKVSNQNDITVVLQYTLDEKGDENDGGEDDIPDKYQAYVEFRSADEAQGTVTGRVRQTFTFADGKQSGDITPSLNGVRVTAKQGYAFGYWVKDNGTEQLENADILSTISNVSSGTTIVFTANFAADTWTDADETDDPDDEDTDDKGDGIPDYLQFRVQYSSEDLMQGTVEPEAEVFTLNDGTEIYAAKGATATAKPNYAFGHWNYNGSATADFDPSKETIAPKLSDVTGGETYTFSAVFGEDSMTDPELDPDPDVPGDDIPDVYQAVVTYRVVGGFWADGTDDDIEKVVTLYEYKKNAASGEWSWTPVSPAPTLGEIPAAKTSGAHTGAWDAEITASTPVTKSVTYTYTFSAKPTCLVSYDLNGGTGAPGVNYSAESVAVGTEVTLKDAPTLKGSTFEGYSDGENIYMPGDSITVTENVTLVAQWKTIAPGVGTITLTKVDSVDNTTTLANVVFDLYNADGTLVDTFITDENGEITVEELTAGEHYWVEVRPAEGYKLDNTKHEFTLSGGEVLELSIENTRAEVPEVFSGEHYAYIIGKNDGLVHPEDKITRAEVATIFFRMLDEETRAKYMTRTNNFGDVAEGVWYNTAISTMAAMGIVNGTPDGNFYPLREITRAEFAVIAARFDTNGNTTGVSFDDIYGHWAQKEINIAANNGWVLGYEDGVFKPDQPITRAEAMAMVNRVLQRIPQSKDDLLPGMINWPDNMDTTKWYYLTIQEATNSHGHVRKPNGYEYWTDLREVPDWSALEH